MNATSAPRPASPRSRRFTAYDANDNPVDDDATQVTLVGDPSTGLVFGTNPITLNNGVAIDQRHREPGADLSRDALARGERIHHRPRPQCPTSLPPRRLAPGRITATATAEPHYRQRHVDHDHHQRRHPRRLQQPGGAGSDRQRRDHHRVAPSSGAARRRSVLTAASSFTCSSSNTTGTCTVTMTSATGTATGHDQYYVCAPNPRSRPTIRPRRPSWCRASRWRFSVQVNNTHDDVGRLDHGDHIQLHRRHAHVLRQPGRAADDSGHGNATLAFTFRDRQQRLHDRELFAQWHLIGIGSVFLAGECGRPRCPAASLIVTSIEMTSIVPAFGVVSRGDPSTWPSRSRTTVRRSHHRRRHPRVRSDWICSPGQRAGARILNRGGRIQGLQRALHRAVGCDAGSVSNRCRRIGNRGRCVSRRQRGVTALLANLTVTTAASLV